MSSQPAPAYHRFSLSATTTPPPPRSHDDEDALLSDESDEEPPPPPPPYLALLQQQQPRCDSSSPPPPPPAMAAAAHPDATKGDDSDYDHDDDSISEDGDDDSDIDAGGDRRSDSSDDDAPPPAPLLVEVAHLAAPLRKPVPKLSFTAPCLPSPIEPGTPFETESPPPPPPPRPVPLSTPPPRVPTPADAVPIEALSTQLNLHMELATFAERRRKSIIMAGASDTSLIPVVPAAAEAEPVPSSMPPTSAPLSRRTHNIRSMSLSLSGPGSFGSSVPSFAPLAASDLPARKRSRTATARARRRGDERIIDIFGDGIEQAVDGPTLTSTSTRARGKSLFAPAVATALPSIGEDQGPASIPNHTTDVTRAAVPSIDSNAASAGPSSVRSSFNAPASPISGTHRSNSITSPSKFSPVSTFSSAEGDDLTRTFIAPPKHISLVFPCRRIIRAPVRTAISLTPPQPTDSVEQLDEQARMLTFLLDTLRARRTDYRKHLMSELRAENAALRQILEAEMTREESGLKPPATEAAQRDATAKAIKKLGRHAEWNSSLHQGLTQVQVQLEDLRRRVQLQAPVAAPTIDEDPTPMPPMPDLVTHKPRPTHSRHSSMRDVPSSISPSLEASVSFSSSTSSSSSVASASLTFSSQVARFPITKINRIRKNTPRILELDLATKTMTICKKDRSQQLPNSRMDDDDEEFTNRDIVIAAGSLVSAELHPKHELQFELSFVVFTTQATPIMGQQHFAPGAPITSFSATPPPLATALTAATLREAKSVKTVKNWKILFSSRADRERFYRLLQVTLLTPEAAAAASTQQTHNGRPHHATGLDPSAQGGPLSTPYPHPQASGNTVSQTYTPRSPALTPSILAQVRLLPLLPLASSLHTTWCLNKKSEGWKYGLKLSSVGPSGVDGRKTHPLLVPFHSLPLTRRDYNLKVVTATLATVLALGFVIRRPFGGDDTIVERGKEKLSIIGSSLGGAIGSSSGSLGGSSPPSVASSSSSTSGTISSDLLSLVDFFAESSHDLWSEEKLRRGWLYGVTIDPDAKRHPGLVPYHVLPHIWQEKERHQAMKILGTLVEWGYELVRTHASTPPTHTGTPSSLGSQPSTGSLKRTIGVGSSPTGLSPTALNTPTGRSVTAFTPNE